MIDLRLRSRAQVTSSMDHGAGGTKLATRRAYDGLDALFVCAALVSVLTYWVAGLRQYTLDVLVTYRYGDDLYLPLVASLAEGNLGDPTHFEEHGRGVVSFPLVNLAPHALALRLLGAPGFVVMDIILVVVVYALTRAVFRAATAPRPLDSLLAFVSACAAPELLEALLGALNLRFPVLLWDLRFPRPLVTFAYELFCCLMLLRLVARERHDHRREWVVAGGALGLAVQANPWAGFTLAAGAALVVLVLWRERFRGDPRRLGAHVASAGAVFAATFAFYVAQRLGEDPSVPARLGLFPVSRLAPLFDGETALQGLAPLAWTAFVLALCARLDPAGGQRRRALAFLAALPAIAGVALPVSCVVLGKSIQPYHFPDEMRVFAGLSMLACLAVGLHLAVLAIGVERFAALQGQSRGVLVARLCAAVLVVLAQMSWAILRHARRADLRAHVRPLSDRESRGVRADYHVDFPALVSELRRPEYAGAKVVATFDPLVMGWWSLFGGGHLFAPNPLVTTAGDEMVERRLLLFCAQLEMEPEQVGELLTEYEVVTINLGLAKYQASEAYAFAPLSEYSPELQEWLPRSSIYNNWLVALPTSERRRLVERYRDLRRETTALPRLDLIVLSNGPSQGPLRPDPSRFELVFQNRVFRIFRPVARDRG